MVFFVAVCSALSKTSVGRSLWETHPEGLDDEMDENGSQKIPFALVHSSKRRGFTIISRTSFCSGLTLSEGGAHVER